jgi:hypothetical protein
VFLARPFSKSAILAQGRSPLRSASALTLLCTLSLLISSLHVTIEPGNRSRLGSDVRRPAVGLSSPPLYVERSRRGGGDHGHVRCSECSSSGGSHGE